MSDRQQAGLPTVARGERSLFTADRRTSLHSSSLGVDPSSPSEVAGILRTYLAAELEVRNLAYRKEPRFYPDGWESYTYGFQLAGPGLPREWTRPLIAHISASAEAVPQLRRAYAAEQFLHEQGFPAPRPLLLEDRCALFGGPLMVHHKVPGRTLLRLLLRAPWRMWGMPGAMGRLHARLHRLPTTGFPASPRDFLTRRLEEIETAIHADGLHGLTAGLDWLRSHRPQPPRTPSILHLDFHPMNLIHRQVRNLVVLDWTEADVGDCHADVASTLMLIACMPLPRPTRWGRLLAPVGRFLLKRWYLSAYQRKNPLDEARLVYYGAWAALHRLAVYGHWQHAGSPCAGCNPTALAKLTPELLRTLQDYFQGRTGVRVCL